MDYNKVKTHLSYGHPPLKREVLLNGKIGYMRKIVVYPSDVLRVKTPEIKEVDNKLIKETEELKKKLDKCDNGAGLAASQIGIAKRFFAEKDIKDKEIKVFINPKIDRFYGEKSYSKIAGENGKEEDFLEGCLSFPDFYGTVKRYLKIDVSWKELEDGKLVSKKGQFTGFDAIVFQHELDHLNGILFVDHIKRDGGKFYKWNGKEMVKSDISKLF